MNNIKVIRFLIVVLVLAHCYTYMHAESTDSSSCSQPRSALQLDLIKANSLSYLMPVTPSARIRLGLDVSIRVNNGNNNSSNSYEYSYPDTSYNNQTNNPIESNSFSGTVTFSALYLSDFISSSYFLLYAGVGPYVTYSRSYSSYKYSYIRDTTTSENDNSYSSYSWTYGATVALGIQIVITRDIISVHAEYGLSAGYQKTTSNGSSASYSYDYMSSSNNASNGNYRVRTFNGVIAGIIFYF